MNPSDLFVGAIAVVLGAVVIVGGAGNTAWWYELKKVKWLDDRLGRSGARVTFFALGAAIILLGVAIACGVMPSWE